MFKWPQAGFWWHRFHWGQKYTVSDISPKHLEVFFFWVLLLWLKDSWHFISVFYIPEILSATYNDDSPTACCTFIQWRPLRQNCTASNAETSSPRRLKGYGFKTPKFTHHLYGGLFRRQRWQVLTHINELTATGRMEEEESWWGGDGRRERGRGSNKNWDGKPKANTCTQTLSIERWALRWDTRKM